MFRDVKHLARQTSCLARKNVLQHRKTITNKTVEGWGKASSPQLKGCRTRHWRGLRDNRGRVLKGALIW